MPDAAADTLTPLICDLLEWIGRAPRTHAEVMDGWRTSCPRLPVWEEATDAKLVARVGTMVELTPRGRAFLARRG
jgi:D-3-phosphoglycerate dehydrogenase